MKKSILFIVLILGLVFSSFNYSSAGVILSGDKFPYFSKMDPIYWYDATTNSDKKFCESLKDNSVFPSNRLFILPGPVYVSIDEPLSDLTQNLYVEYPFHDGVYLDYNDAAHVILFSGNEVAVLFENNDGSGKTLVIDGAELKKSGKNCYKNLKWSDEEEMGQDYCCYSLEGQYMDKRASAIMVFPDRKTYEENVVTQASASGEDSDSSK
jgi:hypothetical protein